MNDDSRHDDVQRRAYELYEQRGRQEGRDWDDWLQAEREIRAEESIADPTDASKPGSGRRRRDREVELAT
jgi:hypothetical protein